MTETIKTDQPLPDSSAVLDVGKLTSHVQEELRAKQLQDMGYPDTPFKRKQFTFKQVMLAISTGMLAHPYAAVFNGATPLMMLRDYLLEEALIPCMVHRLFNAGMLKYNLTIKSVQWMLDELEKPQSDEAANLAHIHKVTNDITQLIKSAANLLAQALIALSNIPAATSELKPSGVTKYFLKHSPISESERDSFTRQRVAVQDNHEGVYVFGEADALTLLELFYVATAHEGHQIDDIKLVCIRGLVGDENVSFDGEELVIANLDTDPVIAGKMDTLSSPMKYYLKPLYLS